METKLHSQSVSNELRDYLKAYYDGFYAALGHNHTGVYSPASHNHQSSQVIYHHNNAATVVAGGTMYVVPSLPGLTTLNALPWPITGTFRNLYVRVNSTQPASGTLVFTVQKNLVDTSLVVTIPINTGAGTTIGNTVNTVDFAPGDLFCIKVKNNATAASSAILGMTWEFRTGTA